MDESWSHPSLLSMMNITKLISVHLPSSTDIEFLHMHDPPLGTFHPWSYMNVLANIPGRACSFPLIHPTGVLLAWYRADTRYSAHCGDSSISLPSGVSLPGVKLVHCAHEACMSAHSGMPLSYLRGNEKKSVMMEDPWWIFLIFRDAQGGTIHGLMPHFLQHVLPSIFDSPLPPTRVHPH